MQTSETKLINILDGRVQLASTALITTVLLFLISRYLRLSHVPGPFLASSTDLWLAIKYWNGEEYSDLIDRLHEIYGPVVRWGPNRVSFAKPSAIPVVYGIREAFPKAESYRPMVALFKGKEVSSLVSIRNEKRATAIKRSVLPEFSQSAWLKQEDQIDIKLKLLLHRLRGETGEQISLETWLRYWSFDTITQLAFSDSQGFLSHKTVVNDSFTSGKARFLHWKRWFALPYIEACIFKNRLVQYFSRRTDPVAVIGMRRIQERQADNRREKKDLMDRYMSASKRDPETISDIDVLALTISTIHAGSEGTAITTALVFFHLLQNPETYERLVSEIKGAKTSIPAAYEDVGGLPYLDAVIRETGRLTLTSATPLERTVTASGSRICETWLPCGTDVSVAMPRTSRDESIYGPDSDKFRPERWLEADPEARKAMERTDLNFGSGRRVCVGIHLAKIEMKKAIASLLMTFKIRLAGKPMATLKDNTREVLLPVFLEAIS